MKENRFAELQDCTDSSGASESEKPSSDSISLKRFCSSSGDLVLLQYLFVKTGTRYSEFWFQGGKVVEIRGWNIDQKFVQHERITHLNSDLWIKDALDPSTGQLMGRTEHRGEIREGVYPLRLRAWTVREGKPIQVDTFIEGTDHVILRQLLDSSGNVTAQYRLAYVPVKEKIFTPKYLQSVQILNANGEVTGNYIRSMENDPLKIWASIDGNEATKSQIWTEFLRPKEPIIIIDSGFDLSHPDIFPLSGGNKSEVVDGKDNDGNGLIDDLFGWNALTKSPAITDSILLPQTGAPFSHGTHVASIALRKTSKFSFIGYAGNMTDANLLAQAKKDIAAKSIRFVNMSFGWESEDSSTGSSPFNPGGESSYALEDLIRSSKDTLFLAAAGNSGAELELGKNCEVPPCLTYANLIKVGALDVSEGTPAQLRKAQVIDFSNRSAKFVDLFAPGDEVLGAGLGGSYIPLSGTSMATPYTLNVLLRMSEINPSLSIQELKALVLLTVYIPDLKNPLPARSGGMLYADRALAAAKRAHQSKDSVEAVAFKVRKALPMDSLEAQQEESEIKSFFESRGILKRN